MAEHFLFKKETTWGTYVAPDTAIPVTNVGIGATQPFMENEDTGGGRGRRSGARGEIAVAGPLNSNLYVHGITSLIASAYGKKQTVAGPPIQNKLLPDDDLPFDSFSGQKRYAADYAESFKGLRLNSWKITAAAKQIAKIETTWVAKDSSSNTGTWTDGTAGAPVIAAPAYPAGIGDPLVFYDGSILLGGTVAVTAGEIVVTGGVARHGLDNVTFEVAYNLITDDYEIYDDSRVINSLDPGKRIVKIGLEPNQATVKGEFFDLWKNGTPAVVQLVFLNAAGHGWKITSPYVQYSNAANAELNNAYALKRVPVAGECVLHPTLGVDHGLVITSPSAI